jgi:hypothetical protein
MPSPDSIAKAVLDRLVDDDLIEVEEHDEAVAALTRALEGAQGGDVVELITEFLDENEVIDEIYATDNELQAAIKSVLSAPAA